MLGINPEKVRHVAQEARFFDASEGLSEPDASATEADGAMDAGLEGARTNATDQEMMEFIRSLDQEEQINLVAIAWVGRGTYYADQWDEALAEATRANNKRTAEYLTSLPKLGDYLEEGLAALEEAGQVDLEDPDGT